MRFFLMACMFCLSIASVGCMTNNWSSPLFDKTAMGHESPIERDLVDGDLVDGDEGQMGDESNPSFWKTKFGESAGVDPRARAIEKRLGL